MSVLPQVERTPEASETASHRPVTPPSRGTDFLPGRARDRHRTFVWTRTGIRGRPGGRRRELARPARDRHVDPRRPRHGGTARLAPPSGSSGAPGDRSAARRAGTPGRWHGAPRSGPAASAARPGICKRHGAPGNTVAQQSGTPETRPARQGGQGRASARTCSRSSGSACRSPGPPGTIRGRDTCHGTGAGRTCDRRRDRRPSRGTDSRSDIDRRGRPSARASPGNRWRDVRQDVRGNPLWYGARGRARQLCRPGWPARHAAAARHGAAAPRPAHCVASEPGSTGLALVGRHGMPPRRGTARCAGRGAAAPAT